MGRDMKLTGAKHQMSAGSPDPAGRPTTRGGEAAACAGSDEAPAAQGETANQGASDLLGQALARQNMAKAWRRVRANKGSAGVDGRTLQETGEYLKHEWPRIRQELLEGRYRPQPVRQVSIPKPAGGTRELGIPTVLDRLIQQALLQVLQVRIDPTFSEHSYGFRPGRSAQDAIRRAQQHASEGYTTVVDVDLEKFFDRVNHDVLMDRLSRRMDDARVLRLIRRYLRAGVMDHGLARQRTEGTPQGGPLSALLGNVMLDEVDRELERRGHRFVRYADDCNVYVKSQRAGERVLQSLRRCYAKLGLRINEAKSAVALAWDRKFLGYRLLRDSKGQVKLGVAHASLGRLKERIRRLTRVTIGRSLEQVIEDLRGYIPGWRNYYRLVQTPTILGKLDGWLRTRLRVVQLMHWRRGPTIYRELCRRGASPRLAASIAAGTTGRWRTAHTGLKRVLTNAYFDQHGVPSFS